MTTLTVILIIIVTLFALLLILLLLNIKSIKDDSTKYKTLSINLAGEVSSLKKQVAASPKIMTLKDDVPTRKDNESDDKYLRRCAMKFQDSIAKNKLIQTEGNKIVLRVVH